MSWLEHVAELVRAALEGFWTLTAQAMDLLKNLGVVGSGLLLLAFVVLLAATGRLMQRRLVKHLRENPEAKLKYLKQEFWFFLPTWPLLPFVYLWRGLEWLATRFQGRSSEDVAEEAEEAAEETQAPYLVPVQKSGNRVVAVAARGMDRPSVSTCDFV